MTPNRQPGPDLQTIIAELDHVDAVARGRAIETLAEREDPSLAVWIRPRLEDEDWLVRFKAACGLAWLGDDSGGSILLQALGHRDLCFMALQALTALGASETLPALRTFFRRRRLHPLERLQTAAALHRSGDGDAADWLLSRLQSDRAEERGFALELCGRLNLPGALDRLRRVLADPKHPHRLDALRGLVELGDRRALPLIERVSAQRDDPELAAEARMATKALRGEQA